ncbi:MAG: hypothetical protein K8823_1520 [Cenarchaeum symbiont of Oopsacas minuta]|nr:hypothetical protein [Cenarchaeum symbiont of Oopsacas minuta]
MDIISLANKAAYLEINNANHAKLSEIWQKMGEILESENVPKTLISTRIKQEIIRQIKDKTPHRTNNREVKISGYFYRVMGRRGWLNPKQQHGYVVPPKSELDTPKKNVDFDLQFRRLKKCITWIIYTSGKMRESLQTEKYQHTLRELSNLITAFENAANKKTKVSKQDQNMFINCLFLRDTIKNSLILYYEKKIELIKNVTGNVMTKETARHYLDGFGDEIPPLMHPSNRDEAIFCGYWGVQCKRCKSWRVLENPEPVLNGRQVRCLECERAKMPSLFAAPTLTRCPECGFILYSKELRYVIKHKKCGACGIGLHLPPELIA